MATQRRRSQTIIGLLIGAVVIALVAGVIGGVIGSRLTRGSGSATGSSMPSTGSRAPSTCDAVRVADLVLPTIVTISAESASGSGVGSGEIIRSTGYILTNNHVISSVATSGTLSVLYSSGRTGPATLVARDPQADLAVLKVDSNSALPTIAVARSSDVRVGQPVVALGAPLGLSSSVSAGIVSALGRDVPVPSDNGTSATLRGVIQTDASINPGNSGGALVNCEGQLVGVNTAIATVPDASGVSGGGSVGIGFAIPSTEALRDAARLISGEAEKAAYFGASVAAIPPSVADRHGVKDGLYIDGIDSSGPAASAGLKVGDIITALDGSATTSGESLVAAVSRHAAGDFLSVRFVRDGTSRTVAVRLTGVPGS